MSVRVMTAVWDLTLPDSEKIVLLALADCANDEGTAWPSMATLARKCSKTDRTVQGCIKRLVAAGHLVRDERIGKGCLYTVTPQKAPPATPEAASPPKGFPPEGNNADPRSGFGQTVKNRQLHTQEARAGKWHRLPDDWQPGPLPDKLAAKAAQWPPGVIDDHEANFRGWAANAPDSNGKGRKLNWDMAWHNWLRDKQNYGTSNRINGGASPRKTGGGGKRTVADFLADGGFH